LHCLTLQLLPLYFVTLLCFLILILTFAGLGFTSLATDKELYVGTGITIFILFSVVAIFILEASKREVLTFPVI